MKRTLFLLIALLSMQMATAQLSEYSAHEYIVAQDALPYRLLAPIKANPDAKDPLVVFLHGSGERGNDNEKQLTWGGQMFLNPTIRDKYRSYVVFPQCPESQFWGYESSPSKIAPDSIPVLEEPVTCTRMLRALVKDLTARYNIDPKRIYFVGLSMGAMGVYDYACRYPSGVAAAVAICGAVNPSRLKEAKGVKWSIYHGDADPVVPVEASRAAYKALKACYADVQYHEFIGCGHNAWNPAFNTKDFFKWMFDQSISTR